MTEEEKLQKAYFVLGLEPGAPMDKIIRRHKRLIMVWHPDRFPTEDGKKDAEEELKQINNAKDNLKSHFEKSHKESGPCACKPSAAGSTQHTYQSGARTGQGPGPGKRKTTQETNREEAEAQRRSKERQQKAAEEAAEKERQRQAAVANAAATQQTTQQAAEQTKLLDDERLRWKVSLCIGAAWIGLSLFGWIGTSVKAWWHDVSWKWQKDHPSHSDSNTSGSNIGTGLSIPPATQPYIAPYNQVPVQNNNPKLWQDPYANTAQPPPGDNTSPPPNLSTPPSLSTAPSLLPTPSFQLAPSNPFTIRQRATDFLNSGSSSSLNIPYAPHVMPTNTPVAPSNDVGSTFKQTIDQINQNSGH